LLAHNFPRVKIFDHDHLCASRIAELHRVFVHEGARKIDAAAMVQKQLLER
jgi:hypothetical protein